jgi:hypothetical protein
MPKPPSRRSCRISRTYGLPAMLTFDRDPRWVGSSSGRDFPSALRRFLLCLGVEPNVCPPEPPDRNCYVERYHTSYNQECLQIHHPTTLEEVRAVTEHFLHHYNMERPRKAAVVRKQTPSCRASCLANTAIASQAGRS